MFYIDDILILGSTYAICLENTMEALNLLINAGFVVHWEKSSLIPSTDFPFLGFLVEHSASVWPSPKRRWTPSVLKPRSSPT
jgi:hypothetical protein